MMYTKRVAILYKSMHHGNTKKLLDAIVAAHPDVVLVEAGRASFDPAAFDVVGFASGIYMGKAHKAVRQALAEMDAAQGKEAFFLYTCGSEKDGGKYGETFVDALREKGFRTLGAWWCLGYDTFGPLLLIGGLYKGRPNEKDRADAVAFFERMVEANA